MRVAAHPPDARALCSQNGPSRDDRNPNRAPILIPRRRSGDILRGIGLLEPAQVRMLPHFDGLKGAR